MCLTATTADQFHEARNLFREYADEIGGDLCFQGFDEELVDIETQYGPPTGTLLLIPGDDGFAACAGVRQIQSAVENAALTCELKRMYVRPADRRRGHGTRLLEEAIVAARRIGYREMRLETLDTMAPALRLYAAHGFVETEPYSDDSPCGARHFSRTL